MNTIKFTKSKDSTSANIALSAVNDENGLNISKNYIKKEDFDEYKKSIEETLGSINSILSSL